jgi:hypothetical protein
MPEEVVEQKPPETPPETPAEPLDERGVPYKNRVAELERKLQEEKDEKLRYMQVLGQQRTQQPQPQPSYQQTASNADDELFNDPEYLQVEAGMTEDSKRFVRTGLKRIGERIAERVAERVGYKFLSNAQVQNDLSADVEIQKEAQAQYQALFTNPLWARADDVLKQQQAVTAAKAVVNARRLAAAQKTQADKQNFDANRDMAGAANLPRTGGGQPQPTGDEKKKFIESFIANEENIATFRHMDRHFDPNTELGKKRLLETAEEAWLGRGGQFWGGKTKAAINALKEQLNG